MFFIVAPIFSSAVPWVFTRTPPGPKIFSAGPRSNFMSLKSNFSFPLAFTFSASRWRKNSRRAFASLHFMYSWGVITIGAFR